MSSIPIPRNIYDILRNYVQKVYDELWSANKDGTNEDRERVLTKYENLIKYPTTDPTIKYVSSDLHGDEKKRYEMRSLFEQRVYFWIVKNANGKDPDEIAVEFFSQSWQLEQLYKLYKQIDKKLHPKTIKYQDEAVREKLLQLALIDKGRPMTKKQLDKAMQTFIQNHPTTMTSEEMHDFYRRNYTYPQTVKPKPTPSPKQKPKKDPFHNIEQQPRLQTSPWTSYSKYVSFKKRNKVDEQKIEERRWEQGPNSFNMKKQSKFMRHAYAPRHTFIIDYFFPGKFMYLLAINVNTRKAFFSVPKEIRKFTNGWYVPTKPKANADSAIESLKDIMKQTTVKGLIMDQEPAWQNDFHAFCNSEGIKWHHYIKNHINGLIETNETSRGTHSTTALIDRLCRTLRTMNYNMGNNLNIDPEQMSFLIDEYNDSPHTTLSRLLGRPTTPNMVDADPKLEDSVVLKLLIENASIELQDDYDVIGKKVRILNEASVMDKLKRKLLPGIWEVISKQNGLFVCKQGLKTVKVSRWMITPL